MPLVTGLTSSIDTVDASTATISFSVTFDSAMNTSVLPVISFPTIGEDPGSALSFSEFAWSNANQTYTATFTVNTSEIDLTDIDVEVTGAQTTSGVPVLPYTLADVFSIDTDADVDNDASIVFDSSVYNATASTTASYTVSGLDADATGMVTITRGDASLTFAVSGNGTFAHDISALPDGPIAISMAVSDDNSNTATAAGDSATLDTTADVDGDLTFVLSAQVETYVNAADSTGFGAVISGLDADASATLTFTDVNMGTVVYNLPYTDGGSWWGFNLSSLDDGAITVSISATDEAGNTAVGTGTSTTLDTVAPDAPAITGFSEDTAAADGITSDTAPTLTGTAEANATVAILQDDVEIGTATADEFGDWSFVVTGPLGDATYAFTATATDAAGNTGALSLPLGFTVDTDADLADDLSVSIAATHINAEGETMVAYSVAGIDADATATVTFTDDAGATVVVSALNGPASVDLSSLADGTITASISVVDTAGNTADGATDTAIKDIVAPDAPVVTGISGDTGTSATDHITNDNTLTISGTAEAGALVNIDIEHVGVGFLENEQVFANELGEWTLDLTGTELVDGAYNVISTAMDAAGNESLVSGAFQIVVDTDADTDVALSVSIALDTINAAADDAVSFTVAGLDIDATAVVTFTDNLGATVEVDVTASGDATADLTGLADGVITASILATDTAGNTATGSTDTATLDATPPAAPIITGISDDTNVAGDGVTSDTTLFISGTAEAGASVVVSVYEFALGSVVANELGDWSLDLTGFTLADQDLPFTAIATDAAENSSEVSDTYDVKVDTVLSVATSIDAITTDTEGSASNDVTPTLNGTAEEGASVEIYQGMTLLGTVTAGTGNSWTFDVPADALAYDTSYTFTAITTDLAGNTDSASTGFVTTSAPEIYAISDAGTESGFDEANDGVGTVVDVTTTATLTTSGSILFEDMPVGNSHIVTTILPPAGALGSFSAQLTDTATIDGLGSVVWSFSLSSDNATLNGLGAGQSLTQSYTVRITDSDGNITDQHIQVRIEGTNDAPVIIGSNTVGLLTEDTMVDLAGDLNAAGYIGFTDADLSDGHMVSVAADEENSLGGSLSASITAPATGGANGLVEWDYVVSNAATQYLAEGQEAFEYFTVTLNDGNGGTVDQIVTITVTGTNDLPTLSLPVTVSTATEIVDGDANETTGTVSANGTMAFADVDLADVHTVGATDDAPNYLGTFSTSVGTDSTNVGTGEVVWSFSVPDADIEYLAEGQELTQSYTVTVNDGETGTAQQTVSVTITGSNDVPTVSGEVTLTASNEDTLRVITTAELLANATDIDLTDVLSVTNLAASSGVLFDNEDGTWNFTPAENDDTSVSFTFTVTDGALTAPGTASLDLTPVNDAPVAAAVGSATTEDDAAPTITASFTDVDLPNDSHTFAIDTTLTVGSVTNNNDGTFSYDPNGQFEHLAQDEIATDTFTYTVTDEAGLNSTTETITITITGVNDAPVAIDLSTSPDLIEGGATLGWGLGDAAIHMDVDSTLIYTSVSLVEASVDGVTMAAGLAGITYDTTNGSVSLDPTAVVYDSLTEGQSIEVNLTYLITDDHGASDTANFNFTVVGTNDVATVTASESEDTFVAEDGAGGDTSASGTLTVSDVDTGEATFAAPATLAGTYGTFTFDTGTGAWTYALDDTNPAVQALRDPMDTLADSLAVASIDGTGTYTVAVTITGNNDAAFVLETSVLSGTANEVTDGAPGEGTTLHTATGTVAFDDFETADTHTVAITAIASVEDGTVADTADYVGAFSSTYDSDSNGPGTGSVSWSFAVNDADIENLGEGQSLTQLYEVTITDNGFPATIATEVIAITINGANDAATITGTALGDVVEAGGVDNDVAGTPSATGNLNHTDIDDNNADDLWLVQTDTAGIFGSLSITSEGVWTYTLNDTDPLVEALDEDETVTDTFTVSTSDGTEQMITVAITGTDDVSVVAGDFAGAVTEGDAGDVATATGSLSISDVDGDDAPVFADATVAGTYGSFALVDGTWTYTLDQALVQDLDALDEVSDTGTFIASDGTEQMITVAITGTDDVSVVAGDFAGAVTEGDAGDVATATGSLSISDVDGDDAPVFADATVAGTYGSFALVDGTWTYTLDQALVQDLDALDEVSDTGTFIASDGTEQMITVAITGTDDVSVVAGDFAGAVTEGDAGDVATATGSLSISDVDGDDAPVFADATVAGTYGSFALVDGTWTYTLDQALVQDLDALDEVSDTGTFIASDGTEQMITVAITGTDDVSVVAGDFAGAVTEGDAGDVATATGSLSISDVDGDDAPVFADATVAGTYGSFALVDGTWTYTLDQALVQDLDALDEVSDTGTFIASDGTEQMITVAITGTDDVSVVAGDFAGAVTEGDAGDVATATGSLSISDVDGDDAPVFADATVAGTYGSFALVDGTWTYTLDQALVQDLDALDEVSDTGTFTASDGTEQMITVAITGTDDVSVVAGDFAGAVTEGDAGDVATATGSLSISDVDGDDAPVFADATVAGTYGSFALVDGTWTYTLDQALVQDLDALDEVSDTGTFTASDGTEQMITVAITGTDDVSVVAGDFAGAVTEGDAGDVATATGSLSISDVDGDDAPVFADATVAGTYGSFALVDGTWTYTLDQALVQDLDALDEVSDTGTFTASDGTEQMITVAITGTDDVSVVAGDFAGAVTEGDAGDVATATGSLSISDVDGDDAPVFADATVAGTYGSFALVDGTWTYTLDQALVQDLDALDEVSDTGTFIASDGTEQMITVAITGTDDVSVVAGDFAGAVTEGDAGDVATATGSLSISDVDGDDAPVFADATVAGTYGSFALVDGTWTYTLDQALVQDLDALDEVSDTGTFTASDGTEQMITVAITGTDDVSVVAGDFAGAVTEGDAGDVATATGSLSISDVDGDDAPVFADATVAGTYGSFALVDGTWTYTLDQALVQDLDAGDEATDTGTFTASDGTEQAIMITITGTNNVFTGTELADVATGSDAVDEMYGLGQNDVLSGMGGDDILIGGDGDDLLSGGAGNDAIDGGAGTDTVDFSLSTDGIVFSLAISAAQLVSVSQGTDEVINVDNVIGSGFADNITGNDGANVLSGLGGNDTLLGGLGDDVLNGDDGDDLLGGGAGVDTLDGGLGNDRLFGSDGADTLLGGGGNDRLDGGADADLLGGGTGNDIMSGGSGDDRLYGSGGADRLSGDDGIDQLYGGSGGDVLGGGNGNDLLDGGTGNDRLFGSAGDDVLTGGLGADFLSGGSGLDTFVFAAIGESNATTRDTIVDFVSGEDLIDLSAIDANIALAGDQEFTFIGSANYTAAGDLRFVSNGTDGFVIGDTNGDGVNDMVIRLMGVTAMTEDDFLL